MKLNGSVVEQIRLYYGGMAAQTSLASATGEFLTNQPWSEEQVNTATSLLEKHFTPISDARANADSRMVMAKNLLLKLWTETNVEN